MININKHNLQSSTLSSDMNSPRLCPHMKDQLFRLRIPIIPSFTSKGLPLPLPPKSFPTHNLIAYHSTALLGMFCSAYKQLQ